jgi:hypothetical protein
MEHFNTLLFDLSLFPSLQTIVLTCVHIRFGLDKSRYLHSAVGQLVINDRLLRKNIRVHEQTRLADDPKCRFVTYERTSPGIGINANANVPLAVHLETRGSSVYFLDSSVSTVSRPWAWAVEKNITRLTLENIFLDAEDLRSTPPASCLPRMVNVVALKLVRVVLSNTNSSQNETVSTWGRVWLLIIQGQLWDKLRMAELRDCEYRHAYLEEDPITQQDDEIQLKRLREVLQARQ